MGKSENITRFILWILAIGLLAACGKDCPAPAINTQKLQGLKRSLFSSGPAGYLVVPNPIEATRNLQATISDSQTQDAFQAFHLPGLASPSRLENDFMKIRIRDINDEVSSLASPDSSGRYAFKISDVHYSEVMAYQSLFTEIQYVENLGFPVVKTRPLYVMVRAKERTENEINAIYDHNYLSPSSPRTIRLFGNTQFAPGMDREMYWHEFGHLFNESASREVGMDYAGDRGAVFTEGSALHECLADYLEYSLSGTPTIGRWLGKNIPGHPAGEPLRTALDKNDGKSSFSKVIINDGGGNPERYTVAEWCTRVLWEIRQEFVNRDGENGAILADKLVFSAVSLFRKDTSLKNFRQNLLDADEKLYCGDHGGTIEGAFEKRGFEADPGRLGSALQIEAEPVALSNGGNANQFENGATIAWTILIRNNNKETARNVRVRLESSDPNLHLITYQQGYGDVLPGKTLSIGNGSMGYDFSVSAEVDRNTPTGRGMPYRIKVMADNGGENSVEGMVSR